MSLLLSPWFWLVLALTAASAAGKGWLDEKEAFDRYKGAVEALGQAAEQHAKDVNALNKQRKETADAEHSKTVADLNARIAGLRNARTNSNFLPTTAASTDHSDRTCFSSSELERAIRSLDQDVQGFVDEGSKAVADLNTAKRWAVP